LIAGRAALNHEDSIGADISVLLTMIRAGDASARDQLFGEIYAQLLEMARGFMKSERIDHSLGASGLVNEAFMKLDRAIAKTDSRRELFRAATATMRRILIDHARRRNAARRQGEFTRVSLDDALDDVESRLGCDFADLDDALQKLGAESPRQREVIELKFFGQQTIAQMAQHLGCSEATVESDWRLARAKLYRWLNPVEGAD
jgi:RNA polymerase sigma factor (TIGR02999 family)